MSALKLIFLLFWRLKKKNLPGSCYLQNISGTDLPFKLLENRLTKPHLISQRTTLGRSILNIMILGYLNFFFLNWVFGSDKNVLYHDHVVVVQL